MNNDIGTIEKTIETNTPINDMLLDKTIDFPTL